MCYRHSQCLTHIRVDNEVISQLAIAEIHHLFCPTRREAERLTRQLKDQAIVEQATGVSLSKHPLEG